MNIAETLDKYTILLIKKEHGLDVEEEFKHYQALVGTHSTKELYSINQTMWDLEDLVSKETDVAKIGAFCLALRYMTCKRIEEKNKITASCGGELEQKNYTCEQ